MQRTLTQPQSTRSDLQVPARRPAPPLAPRPRRGPQPRASRGRAFCAYCHKDLEKRYASCLTCRSSYHPECGLAAEGCFKEGCLARGQGYLLKTVDRSLPVTPTKLEDLDDWWKDWVLLIGVHLTVGLMNHYDAPVWSIFVILPLGLFAAGVFANYDFRNVASRRGRSQALEAAQKERLAAEA